MTPTTIFSPAEDAIILSANMDDRNLADYLFMPVAMVRERRTELVTRPPRPRQAWSEDEEARLVRLRRDCYGPAEISELMGRSLSTINKRLATMRKCS